MKTAHNSLAQRPLKKPYVSPKLELIKLDTEIALVMMSGPPPNPMMPQIPNMPEGGYIQKIFKLY